MANANVEYWRTFRNYESNTVIIADQPQDVVTFKGGNNIDLTFNPGLDTITWEANVPGLANTVKQDFSVVNGTAATLSSLTYDPDAGIFTYYPPDLSNYATTTYVDSKVINEIANIDLSGYTTETWVQGYVGTAVNIPDLSYYASNTWVNEWGNNLNTAIGNIPRGYTGSQGPASTVPGPPGPPGNAVVAGHFVYHQTTPSNVWMINHHLGQRYLNVEVIDVQDQSLSGTYGYPTVTFLDTCNVSVEWQSNTVGTVVLSSGGGQQGPRGFTGSAINVGHQVYQQNVASSLWTVNHNLGVKYLSVEVIDDADDSIVGTYGYPTVTFVDISTLTVQWQQPTTGKIVMSAGGGDTGFNGSKGDLGYTGSQGEVGFTGSVGAYSAIGFTGSQGYTGSSGYTGSQGDTGYIGSQGVIGYTGSAGVLVEPYVHEQNVSSNSWVINHNLGIQYLNVEIVDLANSSITGTYDYPTISFNDQNTCTVSWNYTATGRAILSAGHQGEVGYTGSTGTSEVTTVYTLATLPLASAGNRAFISDSSLFATGNFGNIATSGGSNTVPVYYDGSDWRIG